VRAKKRTISGKIPNFVQQSDAQADGVSLGYCLARMGAAAHLSHSKNNASLSYRMV
jgi:hypothetical protein